MLRSLTVVFSLSLLLAGSAWGQSGKEQALTKAREAIQLVDEGKRAEGIKLLLEAQALDPTNYHYPYETAYAYYADKDYPAAIRQLEPLLKHRDVTDQTYQLLGNSYDNNGDPAKATATYDAGLLKFPRSGPLHLERGIMLMGQKKYSEALTYYEKGIEVAPKFPSNYYWAAKLYLGSNTEAWGMTYGELFMNLERNSKRTAEISKLLYDTYKSEITFPDSKSAKVSFGSNVITLADLGTGKNMKLPYDLSYEMVMSVAVAAEREITMVSLNAIRNNFVSTYFAMKMDEKYPNILFDYQQRVAQAGHAEAYNHWILMKGDEDAVVQWQKGNKEKWDAFVAWFGDHQLTIDDKHRFYRGQ